MHKVREQEGHLRAGPYLRGDIQEKLKVTALEAGLTRAIV